MCGRAARALKSCAAAPSPRPRQKPIVRNCPQPAWTACARGGSPRGVTDTICCGRLRRACGGGARTSLGALPRKLRVRRWSNERGSRSAVTTCPPARALLSVSLRACEGELPCSMRLTVSQSTATPQLPEWVCGPRMLDGHSPRSSHAETPNRDFAPRSSHLQRSLHSRPWSVKTKRRAHGTCVCWVPTPPPPVQAAALPWHRGARWGLGATQRRGWRQRRTLGSCLASIRTRARYSSAEVGGPWSSSEAASSPTGNARGSSSLSLLLSLLSPSAAPHPPLSPQRPPCQDEVYPKDVLLEVLDPLSGRPLAALRAPQVVLG